MAKEINKIKPTFDQWYQDKHMGFTFDAHFLQGTTTVKQLMTALTREIREYVSEMVK